MFLNIISRFACIYQNKVVPLHRVGRMSKNTMEKVKIIEIKKSVVEDNDRAADALRGE